MLLETTMRSTLVLALITVGCGAGTSLPPVPGATPTPPATVVGGQWTAPLQIADAGPRPANPCEGRATCRGDSYAQTYPRIAMNGRGQAVSVWQRFEGGAFRLVAARYEPGRGWDTEHAIEAETGADDPLLTIDPLGNALVVWRTRGELQSSYGPVSGAWTRAQPLASGTAPSLAMDDQGRAYLLFVEFGVGVFAMRFTSAGWTPAEPLFAEDDADRLDIRSAAVSVAPGGDALATWTRGDFGDERRLVVPSSEVWSSRTRPGQAWPAPERIASLDGAVSFEMAAAATDERAALAWRVVGEPAAYRWEVWGQHSGGGGASAWVPPFHVSGPHTTNAILKQYPAFASGARPDLLLTWAEQESLGNGIARNRFRGRWFTPARGEWSAPFPIGDRPDDERGRQDLRAAVGAAGNAIGAWREWQRFDDYRLAASHFVPGSGWSTAQELRGGALSPPAAAVDASGNGLLVWSEWTDARLRIWSARLTAVTAAR